MFVIILDNSTYQVSRESSESIDHRTNTFTLAFTHKTEPTMKVNLLFFTLLAPASANMAQDFVNSLNTNSTIISVDDTTTQGNQRRRKVLRGSVTTGSRELKKHHKSSRKSYNKPHNTHGLNYFVPSYHNDRPDKNNYGKPKFDPGYTVRPGKWPSNTYSRGDSSNDKPIRDKVKDEESNTKPEKTELINIQFSDEAKEEKSNTEYPTLSPSLSPTLSPSTSSNEDEDATIVPTLSPTFSPTLEPSHTRGMETAAPTFIETAEPTLTPTVILTGAPTFQETAEPTISPSLSPTYDEKSTSTTSTIEVITTTGWEAETSNITWSVGRPVRTRAPATPEPTLKETLSPTLSPTLEPSLSPTVMSEGKSSSPTASTEPPSLFPTYAPTAANDTSAPTSYDDLTANEVASSGYACATEFCEHQLSEDYLMEYKVNIPDYESVEECEFCSVTIRLTYDGEVWLGFAVSMDGQMIGSEAVM